MYREQIQDLFQFDKQMYKPTLQRKSTRKPRKTQDNNKVVTKSEDKNNLSKKKQQYHSSIVKQKKQRIIKTSRSKQHKKFVRKQMDHMLEQLDTEEKIQQFLKVQQKRLKGEPDKSWIKVINKLLWSLKCFRKVNCTERWKQTRIIPQLCLTFRRQYNKLGLGHQSADFFSKLILLQPSIIIDLVEYEALQNSVYHSFDKNLPLSQRDRFITLLTTILQKNPKQFIKSQGMENSIQYPILWMQSIIKKNKFSQGHVRRVYKYLQKLMEYVRQRQIEIDYREMESIFKVLNSIVQFDQEPQSYSKIFNIILTMLKLNGYQSQLQPKSFENNIELSMIFVNSQSLTNKMIETISPHLHQVIRLIFGLIKYKHYHDENVLCQQLEQYDLIKEDQINGQYRGKSNCDGIVVQIAWILLNCLDQLFEEDQMYSEFIERLKEVFIEMLEESFQ